MHKVVVERPRGGQSWAKQHPRPTIAFDNLPKHESIKAPHTQRKWFTDVLGPLRRWLRAQIGRPWNDVYSEACAVIKPNSVVRAHIKTHLMEMVARHTFLRDGQVWCFHGSWSQIEIPVARLGGRWVIAYVHPRPGLLRVVPVDRRKRGRPTESNPTERRLSEDRILRRVNGLWFECRMARLSGDESRFDLLSHRVVHAETMSRGSGVPLICVAKRQLSRAELRSYGLTNVVSDIRQSAVLPSHPALR